MKILNINKETRTPDANHKQIPNSNNQKLVDGFVNKPNGYALSIKDSGLNSD